MIAQFLAACKARVYSCVQKDIHFQPIYDAAVKKALSPGSAIVIPDTGEIYTYGTAKPTNGEKTPSIKKDGRYPRNVIDVYIVRNKGKIHAFFYSDQIQMQNLETSSGHHHALHTNQLVPYVTLTTNACLYTLFMYFKYGKNVEDFCTSFPYVDLTSSQLQSLIDWAKEMFPLLEIDVTPADNTEDSMRKAYINGVFTIIRNQQHYHEMCIEVNKMAMFQRIPPVCSPFLTGLPFFPLDSQS